MREGFGGLWAADASGLSLRAAGVHGALTSSSASAASAGGGAGPSAAASAPQHEPIEAEHAIFAAKYLGVTAFPALIVLEPGAGPQGGLAGKIAGLPHTLHRSSGGDALGLVAEPDGLLALLLSLSCDAADAQERTAPMRAMMEAQEEAETASVRADAEKVARWIARDFRLVIFGGAAGLLVCSPTEPVPEPASAGPGAGRVSDDLRVRVRNSPSVLLRALGAVEGPRDPPRVALCSNQGGARPTVSRFSVLKT